MQGAVSACLSLLKPDVAKATREFLWRCCCWCRRSAEEESSTSSQHFRKSGFGFPGKSGSIRTGVDDDRGVITSETTQVSEPSRVDSDDGLPTQNDDFGFDDEQLAVEPRDVESSEPQTIPEKSAVEMTPGSTRSIL